MAKRAIWVKACVTMKRCWSRERKLMEQPFPMPHVPRNKREARAFAFLGEQVLPILAYQRNRTIHSLENCILALSFIGTDAALELLVSYSDDQRPQVQKALWKAWKRLVGLP
jgi:hypothetical protein